MAKTKKTKVYKPKKKVTKKHRALKRRVNKISPVQKGYHNITPCIAVKNAAKAIEFYTKVFGAKEIFRMERPDGKISHAELKIGDSKIMLADECPEMNAFSPKASDNIGFALYLYIKDVDSIIERAISFGAILIKPVETLFYGDRSGTIADPEGYKWHVATHVENVSNAKVKKRAAEFYSKNKHK